MKKNFFKKLSFVLALAMIVSVLAPAAGAFAAAKPKLNATKKYLHLDVDGLNTYNFNIANKGTGWKYSWETSNAKVAKVNSKNGVATATGAGTAKITCFIVDKNGEEKATLTATVTVRDNIETVTITNKPEGGKLAVGVENDFNRSYTTKAGNTKGSESVTRWTVEPTEGATIADNGVFVASKAGKYTVKAWSFQSKAKYEDWKNDPAANASNVLATDSTEVTVAPSMKSATQLTVLKAKVTFDADMSKEVTKDNLKVYSVINDARVNQLVKSLSFDTTGTEATVELYNPMTSEGNYVFVYGQMEAGFKAAKLDVLEVAKVELKENKLVWTEYKPLALEVKIFNKEGVDITTADLVNGRVTYELLNNVGYLAGSNLSLFAKDDKAEVKITYHTYKYNETTWEENVVTGMGVVVAVDKAVYDLTDIEWTLSNEADGDDVKWDNKVTSLAATDYGYTVYAKSVMNDNSKTVAKSWTNDDNDKFTFSSTDENVLSVTESGSLYPIKEGSVDIICYYDKVARTSFRVTVQGERKLVEFRPDTHRITVSNSTSVNQVEKFELIMKDQLNANIFGELGNVTVELVQSVKPDGLDPLNASPAVENNKAKVTVNGGGAGKGTWRYEVKYKGVTRFNLEVVVQRPEENGVLADGLVNAKNFRFTLDKNTVDLKVTKDNETKKVTPSLIGYAANGVACYKASGATTWQDGFYYTISNDADTAVFANDIQVASWDGTSTLSSPTATVTGVAFTAATGKKVDFNFSKDNTYVVNAYNSEDELVGTQRFSVVNTTPAATYSVEANTVTANSSSMKYVLQAVRAAIKVNYNGSEVADNRLYGVDYVIGNAPYNYADADTNDDLLSTGKIVIKKVRFIEEVNGYAVEHTVNVNLSITVK